MEEAGSIQARLDALYAGWRAEHPGEHFVPCGLVDEAAYRAAPFRLVWVLKEPNDSDQHESWTLPGYFRAVIAGQRESSGTSTPLGAYSTVLLDGDADYARAKERWWSGLARIGVTNLKKSGGGARSVWRTIDAEAERTKALWLRELELLAPDVIVCGGTFWLVHSRLPADDVVSVDGGFRYRWWRRPTGERSMIIRAYHPAAIKGRAEVTAKLVATMRHLRMDSP